MWTLPNCECVRNVSNSLSCLDPSPCPLLLSFFLPWTWGWILVVFRAPFTFCGITSAALLHRAAHSSIFGSVWLGWWTYLFKEHHPLWRCITWWDQFQTVLHNWLGQKRMEPISFSSGESDVFLLQPGADARKSGDSGREVRRSNIGHKRGVAAYHQKVGIRTKPSAPCWTALHSQN